MKRLTLTAAALITVIGAAFASGNGTESVRASVMPFSETRYKVFYTAAEADVVKIRIRNAAGDLVRMDRIKNEGGFVKPYDLSQLDKGTYTFELTDQHGVITKDVEVSEKASKETFSMVVNVLEDNKYRLIVDQSEKLPISLTIYNAEGDIIHKEKYSDISGFSRVYDLSKFNSKNFRFEVADGNSSKILAVN